MVRIVFLLEASQVTSRLGLLKPHAKEALASRVCPNQKRWVEAK